MIIMAVATKPDTIKQARERSGLTQKQMSEKFEIPVRTIGSWEDGSRKCPVYVKNLIIQALSQEIKSKK